MSEYEELRSYIDRYPKIQLIRFAFIYHEN